MSVKYHWFLALTVALYLGWLLVAPNPQPDLEKEFQGPLWLFNFGPENAPDFLTFNKISSKSIYNTDSGFGWINLKGKYKNGTWKDKSLHWESTDNLNTIMRSGPDDLALSFATGPATFAVDVKPGNYDVWTLTGDWGLLEYVPYDSYSIEIEGSVAANIQTNEDEFYRLLSKSSGDDAITHEEVYELYVKPRFQWKKVTVSVTDGQLSVAVASQKRDHSLLKLLGNYPWSELRSGPDTRFSGALNALIITPSNIESQSLVERVETMRRKNFLAKLTKKAIPQNEAFLNTADLKRGYNVYFPDIFDTVTPNSLQAHSHKSIKLLATRGEYAPITFAISPHQRLGETQIVFDSLTGPHDDQIKSSDIHIGEVRYVADPVNYRNRSAWQPVPGPIVPINKLKLTAKTSKQFWITLHVPDDAEPGQYQGNIQILPTQGEPATIPVKLNVLPFELKRPTHLATGLTYFVPIMHAYFGKERFWKRVREEFADMRRHNMTSVQLTGMGMDNYDDLDQLFSAYSDAGFEQPIYFLESASTVNLFCKKYGCPKNSNEFYEKYVETTRNFITEKKSRRWPEVVINFGDELTNDAAEEFGAELAIRLKQIPGILTGADVNGYKELELLAPHVSILAFNSGWTGPTGINKGKRQLLHAETIDKIKELGSTPWLVNTGKDRFSNGYYYWKMSRLGLQGKMEWIYSNYRALPHNAFDGRGSRSGILDTAIYPGTDDTILSTIPYERMRQGLDDLAYLHTLQYMTENAASNQLRRQAEALIARIDQMVDDDFSKYRSSTVDEYRWNEVRYDTLRHEISNMILKLKDAAEFHGSRSDQ